MVTQACTKKEPAMADKYASIVLIGMPGAGKSTVGVLLAKQTCRSFVDTDVLIQTSQGRPLQDIVDREGHLALRAIEEQVILQFDCRNCVIATGGSAVYSPAAMAHLKQGGIRRLSPRGPVRAGIKGPRS
jgi:shikimate kinase